MPQDQDDIKGADAMKQAPTPGPLTADDVKLLVKGDLLRIDTGGALYEFVRRKSSPSALIVAKPALGGSERYYDLCRFSFVEHPSLAPTAPVEASGSERDVQGLVRPDAMAGRRWRHKERGTTYTSLGFGKAQCSPAGLLDDENVVIYQGDDDGSLWTRRHAEFTDGRFEEIQDLRPAPVASGGQHSSATDFPPDDVLACVPVAETAGEAVGVVSGCARADLYTADLPTGTLLYAAPVPAQDDDKLRTLADRVTAEVKRGADGSHVQALGALSNIEGLVLSALKSTAAQEGEAL